MSPEVAVPDTKSKPDHVRLRAATACENPDAILEFSQLTILHATTTRW
jgi:hypothetical protein